MGLRGAAVLVMDGAFQWDTLAAGKGFKWDTLKPHCFSEILSGFPYYSTLPTLVTWGNRS